MLNGPFTLCVALYGGSVHLSHCEGIFLCMASESAIQGPRQISARCITYSPKSPVRRANFWVKRTTFWFGVDVKYRQSLQVLFLLIPLHFDPAHALDVDFFAADRRHLLVLKRELSRAYVVAARNGIRGATATCGGESDLLFD